MTEIDSVIRMDLSANDPLPHLDHVLELCQLLLLGLGYLLQVMLPGSHVVFQQVVTSFGFAHRSLARQYDCSSVCDVT